MLYKFLQANRTEILTRARQRVASRNETEPTTPELETGLPVFLDQLGDALRLKQQTGTENQDPIVQAATRRGSDLWREGFTVRQVVQDYGDICQVVTALALERNAPVTTEEFRTLNLCLDDATAEAVTAYARQSDGSIREEGTERLGVLVHEMRNLLNTAIL